MPVTVTNQGARVDLIIRRGATFTKAVQFTTGAPPTPVDITGRAYAGQIRKVSDGTLITSFTCVLTDPTNGWMTFSLTNAQTALLAINTDYVWDLEETNGTAINEIFFGRILAKSEVTV